MKAHPFPLAAGLLMAAFLLAGCGPKYGPAFLGSNNAYMVKPAYHGARANAVSLNARTNSGAIYYEGEKNHTYEFSGHVSLMRRNFYYSGGLFGYFGRYQIDTTAGDAVHLTPYQVNGFGARHEVGARIPLDKDWDLLMGVGLQTFNESGKFADLTRDQAQEVVTKIFLFPFVGPDVLDEKLKSGGAGYDVNFDIRYTPSAKDYTLGMRYSWSASQGKGFTDFIRVHQLTLHGSYKRFSAYGQIGFAGYRENLYDLHGNLFHAGLSYSIPFGRKKKTPAVEEIK